MARKKWGKAEGLWRTIKQGLQWNIRRLGVIPSRITHQTKNKVKVQSIVSFTCVL